MTSYLGVDIGKTNLRVALFRPDLTLHHVWSASAASVPAGLAALREHLRTLRHHHRIRAAGLSIFGPLQVDRIQPSFGALIESSEPAWSGVNVPALLRSTCACPVFFDYDVNAGALAEAEVGAARHVRRFVYLSVGTGIGGAIFDGRLIAGHAPQLGHMFLPREPDDLEFPGTCRFHGACLQGLASGKALEARWRVPAQELPPDHPAWNLEARYLARACANLVYTASPECVVLGSSVTGFLFEAQPVNVVCGGPMLWNLEDAAEVMKWYREFILHAPEEMNGFFAFLTVPAGPPFPEDLHGRKMCGIVWCYQGSMEQAQAILDPVCQYRPPAFEFFVPMPFPMLQGMFDGLYPSGLHWYWKADFFNELTDQAITLHIEHAEQLPTALSPMHYTR